MAGDNNLAFFARLRFFLFYDSSRRPVLARNQRVVEKPLIGILVLIGNVVALVAPAIRVQSWLSISCRIPERKQLLRSITLGSSLTEGNAER